MVSNKKLDSFWDQWYQFPYANSYCTSAMIQNASILRTLACLKIHMYSFGVLRDNIMSAKNHTSIAKFILDRQDYIMHDAQSLKHVKKSNTTHPK